MAESVLDRKFAGRVTVEKAAYAVLFLIALTLLTYHLGQRPYHHDESIHAFFSWKITQEGVGNYRYDPVYHGPVLYYASALVMWLFGDSNFTGRLSAVLFGLGVIGFAWPLRRYLGRWGALVFLGLITFSPAWIYFIRFVRHDIYLALGNLAAIFFAFRYGETRRAPFLYASAASLAVAFCTKEDNYFLTPIFLIALILTLVWGVLGAENPAEARARVRRETGELLRHLWLPLITSALIFCAIWAVFYTSLFAHPEKWNAVVPALTYWTGQHEVKRIGGAWWYYLPQLSLYDPLIFFPTVAIVLGPLIDGPPRRPLARVFWALAVACVLGLGLALWKAPATAPLVAVAALGFAALTFGTLWVPDRFMRFTVLWALAALTVYGWAQEKVPWLLVPQLLPLTLVAGKWYGRLIERGRLSSPSRAITAGAVGLLTLWSLYNVNYVWDAPKPDEAGSALRPPVRHDEMLSYVQSTYHINKLMRRIEQVAAATGTGTQTRLAVSGNATWPFSWYLRHYPVNWAANLRKVDTPVVVVDKEVAKTFDKALLDTYERIPFQIRAWWQWESNRPTLPELMRWLFTRRVWSPTGSSDGVMYVHKDLRQGMKFPAIDVNPPPAARPYLKTPEVKAAMAVWGKEGTGDGEFREPRGLAVDSAGNLYVVDSKNNRIQKLAPDGTFIRAWGGQGNAPGEFKDPCGVAVGPDGAVYVADTWNHRVQKFDPNGTFLKQWTPGDSGFWGPRGIAVAPDGTVFVTDTGNKRVVAFSGDGQYLREWGKDGSKPGEFIEPVGIAVTPKGEVAVADTGNRRIQFFTQEGSFLREWPIYGWEEFYTEPYIVAVGDAVYATDSFNHRFARYRNGSLDGVWGKTGQGPGSFNRPIGIAADRTGNLYIADTLNHRIQKFGVVGEPPKAKPLGE